MMATYKITISNPIVRNGKMLLSISIPDVYQDACFFYPLHDIDNKNLMVHVMWKLSGDPSYSVKAEGEVEENCDLGKVKIKNWRFA